MITRPLLTLLLVLTCFGDPASAQNLPGDGDSENGSSGGGLANKSPPPEKLSVTDTGVDIRTGRFAYSREDLAIGSLKLVRQITNDARGHLEPFANMSHNWDIFIAERRFDLNKNLPPISEAYGRGNDFQLFVHYGGTKHVFTAYEYSTGTVMYSGSLGYLSVAGSRASSSALYTYQSPDGARIEFRPIGSGDCSTAYRCAYASKITQPNGEIFTLSYDAGGPAGHSARLAQVQSSRGYIIRFEYLGAGTDWHKVTKACAFNLALVSSIGPCGNSAQQQVSYTYNGKLTSATDAAGHIWHYQHSNTLEQGGTMRFYKPGQSVPYMINTLERHVNDHLEEHEIVRQQSFADGRWTTFDYHYAPFEHGAIAPDYPHVPELAGGMMQDSSGRSVDVQFGFHVMPGTFGDQGQNTTPHVWLGDIKYQTTPGPERIVDELGRVWTMNYCDPAAMAGYPPSEQHRCLVGSDMLSSTDLEGIKTEYQYDAPHTRNTTQWRVKAKPGSGLADQVSGAIYDCWSMLHCRTPISTTDAKGQVTTFEYSGVHGGLLRKTLPPDSNGVRAVTRYLWGQRSAVLATGAVQPPIWLLLHEEACRTSGMEESGNCAAGSSDKVVTSYDYGLNSGPNNLLLRGLAVTADGETRRTCYGYDAMGRRVSETRPQAGLASCP